MFNQPTNAQQVKDFLQREKEQRVLPLMQTEELQKQTKLFEQVINLSNCNSEQIEKLLECVKQNQISSNRQFCASIIISITALIISFLSLYFEHLQALLQNLSN